MRLLKLQEDGEIDIEKFDDGEVPPYAILSHTWGPDRDEVTFSDLTINAGKTKEGFYKLYACGKQAQSDNLEYFWVDTCCINKEDQSELSHAIRSMFLWYKNAAKCYAYLSDVSERKRKYENTPSIAGFEPAFRSSRWFRRGWTLQELLAPSTVEFFSYEWKSLGDRTSLKSLIQEITGISYRALSGVPLSQFSVDERLHWKGKRETTLEEDAWYSLAGILDVQVVPAYSEGAASAFKRLMDEINKLKECLRDIRNTDPRDDKKRIEETKGGLLVDSYRWILDNATFQQWQNGQENQLLWIKGLPGKGKTMLLCGIIDELQSSQVKTTHLAYFFCQATDSRINSATAVLRGLLYMILDQQPSLVLHVRKKYDEAGRALFEDVNAWVALTDIFQNVLQDPNLEDTYFMVDALDECVTALPELLSFIAKWSSVSSHVKWMVSSRNEPIIEEQLERAGSKIRVSLELNAEYVSTAVSCFIQWKVNQLAEQKKYDTQTRNAVLRYLKLNANDTFLWVALVCQSLESTAKRNVLKKLKSFPSGLEELYQRMMQQISVSDDAELCKQILALNALVYRPLTLGELLVFVDPSECIESETQLREMIGFCGSFLTIRKDTIYFVHQSAQDYLLAKATEEIHPQGVQATHRLIYSQSIATLSEILHRDMYNLQAPGFSVDKIEPPDPNPLGVSRYSCIYWVDHLFASNPDFRVDRDLQIVDEFMKKKFLYWLEGLSLCKSIPKGIISLTKLNTLVQETNSADKFAKRIYDGYRFILYHKHVIENYPLQAYASALLFSPLESETRTSFYHEEPTSIKILSRKQINWNACLQSLEHEGCGGTAVSPDSRLLASVSRTPGSREIIVKLWDATSGECLRVHELQIVNIIHTAFTNSLAFSKDSKRVGVTSGEHAFILDIVDDNVLCLSTHQEFEIDLGVSTFSHDLNLLAASLNTGGGLVKIWNVHSGECIWTIRSQNTASSGYFTSLGFSHESTRLAVASVEEIMMWDLCDHTCIWTFNIFPDKEKSRYSDLACSSDSRLIACIFRYATVLIIDANSGMLVRKLDECGRNDHSPSFSPDSKWLALGTSGSIKIWDLGTGSYAGAFDNHGGAICSVVFSPDSTKIFSASYFGIKMWQIGDGYHKNVPDSQENMVSCLSYHSVVFSPNSKLLAALSSTTMFWIWDTISSKCIHTLEGHRGIINDAVFSHDSKQVASASSDKTLRLWNLASGECLFLLSGHHGGIVMVVFSHDSRLLASASRDRTVKLWSVEDGKCLTTLKGHTIGVVGITFSTNDPTRLASISADETVRIWDTRTSECVQIFHLIFNFYALVSLAFSHDGTRFIAKSYETIRFWDLRTAECLHDLKVSLMVRNISFDSSGAYLNSNIGPIAVPDNVHADGRSAAPHTPSRSHNLIGLSMDGEWITRGFENVVWLPSDYRPGRLDSSERTIAIVNNNGLFMVTFE